MRTLIRVFDFEDAWFEPLEKLSIKILRTRDSRIHVFESRMKIKRDETFVVYDYNQ